MHSAPSVSYPVGRSHLAGLLALGVWLLAALVTSLWWAQSPAAGWRTAVAGFVLLAAGVFAGWKWWHSPQGALAWDGESWRWTQGGSSDPGTPSVGLDLQRCLLLRWTGDAGVHWLWLERGQLDERWDDLRRAVYSRARPEAPTGAQPPAAKT